MNINRELLLIRGLPGSGKTTMAKQYAQIGYVHCEADQYFERDGEYRFDGRMRSRWEPIDSTWT